MTTSRLLATAAILAVLTTTGARAETRLETSNKKWAEMDTCSKQSFQKYPDYNAESANKRDAFMRDCLRTHRLPPRNNLAQPQPPKQ